MKNTLRETLNEDGTRLNVSKGQFIFYSNSRIFGKISDVNSIGFVVDWDTSSGDKKSNYCWDSITSYVAGGMTELLDHCILCESDEEKLFIALKYGK